MSNVPPTNAADIQVALTLAEQLSRVGRLEEALAQYRWAAGAFRHRGELHNSVSVYLIIGALAPRDIRTQIECADFYAEVGLVKDAVAIYEWAETIYMSGGMIAAAAWVLARAVEADPDVVERRMRLAELCLHVGRTDDAVNALHGAAQQFFSAARTDEYVWVAERILGLDPHHVQTLRDLTRVRLFLRDVPRVSANLQTLFHVAPKDDVGGELLAETLALLGRPRDAARVAKSVARQRSRVRDGSWRDEAKRVVERALQWVPDSPELHKLRGRIDEDTRFHSMRDSGTESVVTGVVEFVSDAVMLSHLADGDDDGPTSIRPSRVDEEALTSPEPPTARLVPFRRNR